MSYASELQRLRIKLLMRVVIIPALKRRHKVIINGVKFHLDRHLTQCYVKLPGQVRQTRCYYKRGYELMEAELYDLNSIILGPVFVPRAKKPNK